MSSANANPYDEYREILLKHSRESLLKGVRAGFAPRVSLREVPKVLCEERATFVTLHKNRKLRGCIGRLEASRPLYTDIAENTVAAALEDYRFPPVSEGEVKGISISISILTPPEKMKVGAEEELIANLRPGIDGLILQEAGRRATFLPSVWEELPMPVDFIRHLKLKAGMAPDHWSKNVEVFTYQTHYLSEGDKGAA